MDQYVSTSPTAELALRWSGHCATSGGKCRNHVSMVRNTDARHRAVTLALSVSSCTYQSLSRRDRYRCVGDMLW